MGNEVYKVTSYESLSELCKSSSINEADVLGGSQNNNNEFISVTILESNYMLGIAYYNHGIKPQILVENTNSKLFIGYEKQIICFDYKANKIVLQKDLGSLFYEILKSESHKGIVVVCELDIYVFDSNSKIIWTIGFNDIIVDYHIEKDSLFVACNDGDKTTFLITNGSIVNNR